MIAEVDELTQELIDLESTGQTCDEIEQSKILLSIFIINIKNRKRAKDRQIVKMVEKFTLSELISQHNFLDKRFTKQEIFNAITKLWNSKGRGSVVNPKFFS